MALRLQKAKDLPILLSGGTILKGDANESEIEKRMLLSLGVLENKIFMDDKSRNTAENAAFFQGKLCRAPGTGRSPSWSPAPSICPGRSASLRAKAWT